MVQLPLTPSRTCRHHASTPFLLSSDADAEEQSRVFEDVALWIFQHDTRVHDPKAELQNPKYDKLLDRIGLFKRRDYHFLRFMSDDLRLGAAANCPFCEWMVKWLHEEHGESDEYFTLLKCDETTARFVPFKLDDGWFDPSSDNVIIEYFARAYFFTWAPSGRLSVLKFELIFRPEASDDRKCFARQRAGQGAQVAG